MSIGTARFRKYQFLALLLDNFRLPDAAYEKWSERRWPVALSKPRYFAFTYVFGDEILRNDPYVVRLV